MGAKAPGPLLPVQLDYVFNLMKRYGDQRAQRRAYDGFDNNPTCSSQDHYDSRNNNKVEDSNAQELVFGPATKEVVILNATPSTNLLPVKFNMQQCPGPSRYIADTGAPVDVVGRQNMSTKDLKRATLSPIIYTFDTAGGSANASEVIHYDLNDMGGSIEPLILDNTPDLISVGLRVETKGYGFFWEPWQNKAVLLRPGKSYSLWYDPEDVITLPVEDHIPFYYDDPSNFKVQDRMLAPNKSAKQSSSSKDVAVVPGAEAPGNERCSYHSG
jgi:hypothetical protein